MRAMARRVAASEGLSRDGSHYKLQMNGRTGGWCDCHNTKAGSQARLSLFTYRKLDISFRGSLQQPLFRRLEIGKRLDIYTSITSRHQEKPSRVHSLRFLNKCDFYTVSRENLRFFRRQVFFYNGDFPLGSRYVNEKFIALRATAMLGN